MAQIILGDWAGKWAAVQTEVSNQHETVWREETWEEGDATVQYGALPERAIAVRKINSSPEIWAEINAHAEPKHV